MSQVVNHIELFHKSLTHSLNEQERAELNALLKDENINQEFERYQRDFRLMGLMKTVEIKEKINQLHANPPKSRAKWWWACGIILLAGLGVLAVLDRPKAIYEEVPSRDENPIVVDTLTHEPNSLEVGEVQLQGESSLNSATKKENLTITEKQDHSIVTLDTVVSQGGVPNDQSSSQPDHSETLVDSVISKPPENPQKVIKENQCPDQFSYSTNFEVSPSCQGQSNGHIAFDASAVSGGLKPYVFSLVGQDGFSSFTTFNSLEEGTYTVLVKDKNGCIAPLGNTISVSSKTCIEKESFVFSLGYSDPIQFNFEYYISGKFIISNRVGNVVANFVVDSDYFEWDGHDEQGNAMSIGSYYFKVVDGSEVVRQGVILVRP